MANITSQEWITQNLNVVTANSPATGEEVAAVSWGNGIYTAVDDFVTMFDTIIQTALTNSQDVKSAIKAADNGRGFAGFM